MPSNLEKLAEEIKNRRDHPNDYHRVFDIRAGEPQTNDSQNDLIVEGKAVSFNDRTLLFTWGDTKVFEIIDRHAFDDSSAYNDTFFKYNHSEEQLPLARVRNGTLSLTIKDAGLYMRAKLNPEVQISHDLFASIKRGDINKMSFAFTTDVEAQDNSVDGEVTFTVQKIRKLYDVAAVMVPAYENTEIYARRQGEVETYLAKVETEKRAEELRLLRLRAGAPCLNLGEKK